MKKFKIYKPSFPDWNNPSNFKFSKCFFSAAMVSMKETQPIIIRGKKSILDEISKKQGTKTLLHIKNHLLIKPIAYDPSKDSLFDQAVDSFSKKDFKNSLNFFEKSANEKNNKNAFLFLGVFHLLGLDVEKNQSKARNFLQKSCDMGSEEGINTLAFVLDEVGSEEDKETAKKLYQTNSENRNITGKIKLAMMLLKDKVDGNNYKARELLEEVIEEGNTEAMNLVNSKINFKIFTL